MRRAKKTGKKAKRCPRIFAGLFLSAHVSLLLTGCPGHIRETTGDPLYGEHGLKQNTPNPQPPPPPAGKTQASVQPVPTASFSPTTAELASIPGARTLAIDGSNGTGPSVQPTTGTALPNSGKPSAFTPVVMPVPRASGQNVVPASGTWAPQPAPNTPAALLSQLEALGIRDYWVDNVPEGFHFTAKVPNRTDPTSFRLVEATHPDQAAAIQAVLRQIENQR